MNYYQMCHAYYGDLTREATIARELLERHGKPTPQIVKELRHKTDMPMTECACMLRCTWRDMQLERLQVENQKLRELLDFALPIAMYAASTEEGDRIRELMQGVEL